jgi:2-polyprenyl-6-methoxyphenol hydroxylase-like FAD-dependent oxidoreductase
VAPAGEERGEPLSPIIENYDVAVAGGGPGGSTVATLLAKRGHRVVLLKKGTFPRYAACGARPPASCRCWTAA